jgi:hypothetical protein
MIVCCIFGAGSGGARGALESRLLAFFSTATFE